MPATTPIRKVPLPGPVKGVRGLLTADSLTADQLRKGENIFVLPNGAVRPFADPVSASGTVRLESLHEIGDASFYYEQSGGWVGVRETDGGLNWFDTALRTDTTVFTPTATKEAYVSAVATAENSVYITKKVKGDQAHKLAGGTATSITPSVFDGTSGRFPLARTLAYKNDVMFAGNAWSGTTDYESRVWWSNLLDVETWDAADFVDFEPGDGQAVQKIIQFGEDLVVFKNHKMFLLSGRSEASFSVYKVSDVYGTSSPYSVQIMDDLLIFLDEFHGVMAFNGSGFSHLSTDHWGDRGFYSQGIRVDAESIHKAAATVSGDLYLLSVTEYDVSSASAFNDLTHIWDRRTEAWTRADIGFSGLIRNKFRGDLLGTSAFEAGGSPVVGVARLSTPDAASNEASRDMLWRTPNYRLSETGEQVRIRRLYLNISSVAAVTLTVRMYVDGSDTAHKTINVSVPSGGGSMVPSYHEVGGWSDVRAHSVAFQFEATPTLGWFEVTSSALGVSDLGVPRGS